MSLQLNLGQAVLTPLLAYALGGKTVKAIGQAKNLEKTVGMEVGEKAAFKEASKVRACVRVGCTQGLVRVQAAVAPNR